MQWMQWMQRCHRVPLNVWVQSRRRSWPTEERKGLSACWMLCNGLRWDFQISNFTKRYKAQKCMNIHDIWICCDILHLEFVQVWRDTPKVAHGDVENCWNQHNRVHQAFERVRTCRTDWTPKFTLRKSSLYPSLISVQLAPGVGVAYRPISTPLQVHLQNVRSGVPDVPHVIPVFPVFPVPGGGRRRHQPQAVLVIDLVILVSWTHGPGKGRCM